MITIDNNTPEFCNRVCLALGNTIYTRQTSSQFFNTSIVVKAWNEFVIFIFENVIWALRRESAVICVRSLLYLLMRYVVLYATLYNYSFFWSDLSTTHLTFLYVTRNEALMNSTKKYYTYRRQLLFNQEPTLHLVRCSIFSSKWTKVTWSYLVYCIIYATNS